METNLALDFDAPWLSELLHQRVCGARDSGKLGDCEADVLEMLTDAVTGPCVGRAKAMQISAMQEVWTRRGSRVWSDRSVKDAVKQLLEVHEVPIGSSRIPGSAGYFLVATDDDLEVSERPLRGELLSIAKRLRALNPKSTFARQLLGQLQLEGEA